MHGMIPHKFICEPSKFKNGIITSNDLEYIKSAKKFRKEKTGASCRITFIKVNKMNGFSIFFYIFPSDKIWQLIAKQFLFLQKEGVVLKSWNVVAK